MRSPTPRLDTALADLAALNRRRDRGDVCWSAAALRRGESRPASGPLGGLTLVSRAVAGRYARRSESSRGLFRAALPVAWG